MKTQQLVFPIQWVVKNKKTIRLCFDMHIAKTFINREKHTFPTRYLQEACHQILLHPDSQSITLFETHKAFFQYKCLISCFKHIFAYYQVMSNSETVSLLQFYTFIDKCWPCCLKLNKLKRLKNYRELSHKSLGYLYLQRCRTNVSV